MLCIIDEFTRESLAIRVARKLKATDVIEALCDLFICAAFPRTSVPTTARSSSPRLFGNGSRPSEPRPPTSNPAAHGRTAIAKASTASCAMNCSTARSSTHCKEAKIVIEDWRRHYNTVRPHSSLGYRPPAPEAIVWPTAKPVAQMPALN